MTYPTLQDDQRKQSGQQRQKKIQSLQQRGKILSRAVHTQQDAMPEDNKDVDRDCLNPNIDRYFSKRAHGRPNRRSASYLTQSIARVTCGQICGRLLRLQTDAVIGI